MAKASILLLLLLASILFMSMVSLMTMAAERENHSSSNSLGGILWSTGTAEGDLLAMADSSPVEEQTDEFAGGFSSLDGMLQWAIGHSDPAKLKEKASDVRRLSADELKKRQLELKELMEKLKMPSDAELMRIAIADLKNSSLSLEDRQRALNELLILVEPIDNANDLDKLGGLVAVVHELHNTEPEIRITSAWILGKASQNNVLVQKQILSLGALTKLMKMVKSGSTEEAIKALYAVSALIRNNNIGQELFFSENGDLVLQDIMNDSRADIRVHKKAALLVSDLADYQLANVDNVKLPFFSNRLLLKSVVGLASSTDLDLQEKALSAIRSLLQLSYTEASVFKDFCNLDGVLERSREHLENLMTQEDLRDYARDIEALRREVYIIFRNKLAGKGDMGANMNMLAR